MAAVCRRVCGVTFLSAIDGQAAAAVAACLATSRSTASRESGPPRLGGEQRVRRVGRLSSASQARSTATVWAGERGGPVLAALAVAADVRAGAEVDVVAGQAGELGDPQSGLDGEQEQGVVAAAVPGLRGRGRRAARRSRRR